MDFDQSVMPYRGELLVHCYRMTGSLTDAEDLVQETLLAAWRGLDGFEGRASLRSWLYRIATNRCLNALRDGRRRTPPPTVPPFQPPEPTRHGDLPWLQPFPERPDAPDPPDPPDPAVGPESCYTARESIELAFVAALQRLAPRQAAALILCDVLGYRLSEAAQMLDATPTAVKGLLQRARKTLVEHRGSTHGDPPAPDSPRERDLVRRFADAFVADDVEGVIALLTDDAWLAMPPALHEYQGVMAIASFLTASADFRAGRRPRLTHTRANGQPAFGCHLDGAPAGLIVLTLAGDRIHGITRFFDTRLFPRFGLPVREHPFRTLGATGDSAPGPQASPGRR